MELANPFIVNNKTKNSFLDSILDQSGDIGRSHKSITTRIKEDIYSITSQNRMYTGISEHYITNNFTTNTENIRLLHGKK